MTREEFLIALGETKRRKWNLVGFCDKILRVGHDRFCPLTAVCDKKLGKKYSIGAYHKAAYALDIDAMLCYKIAVTADDCKYNPDYDEELRQDMLKVLGVKE